MPQGTTRTQPASLSFLFASLPLFLHLLYLFLSSSSLLVSLSAPLRIFFFFLPHFSSLVLFSLYLCPRTHLSLSSCLSVRPLLRIYESTRLYKWTHCSFLGQRVARGSLLSFKKGVVFRCRASHGATRAPRKRDNRKWYIASLKRMLRYIRGIEIREKILSIFNLINNQFFYSFWESIDIILQIYIRLIRNCDDSKTLYLRKKFFFNKLSIESFDSP